MTARQLVPYLNRIRDAKTPPELRDTAEDAERKQPTDEATPGTVAMVTAKIERLVSGA